ncbi:MAG: hypothetical protein HGA90_00955 [Alphaproteobacteria bacterium]|nr:hypothetical protein [Alphaproteobacteria bacterium]
MKKALLALGLCAALTACASESSPPSSNLDYSSMGKVALDVQDLRVVNRAYATPQWPPYVGHLHKPYLADAVSRWAADRFQAVGSSGQATIIIKDAGVSEQVLPVSRGYESVIERAQTKKYVGRLDVALEAMSPDSSRTAIATAHAERYETLPDRPSEAERSAVYRKLLDGLMADMNKNMNQAISQHMGAFVTMAPANAVPAYAMPQQAGEAPAPRAVPLMTIVK